MKAPQDSRFLLLLALGPLVQLVAGATLIVTYLNLGYALLLFAYAVYLNISVHPFWSKARRWMLLPTMYVVVFFVTSYFGADFEYSIRYRVLLLPMYAIDFFIWFAAGYCFDERDLTRKIYIWFTVFALMSFVFASTGLMDAEATRVIYGPEVPFALVAAAMNSKFVASILLLLAALASVKKTVVLCAVIGLAVTAAFKISGKAPGWHTNRISTKRVVQGFVVLCVLAVPIVQLALPYMEQTFQRIEFEEEDVMRVAMADEFLRLLQENFPRGIGYYSFGYLTQDTLPYTTATADGIELQDGMSLHNTLMHLLLEGGLPVTLIVVIMTWRFVTTTKTLYSAPEARGAAVLIIGWTLVCFVYSLFNQLHGTRYYFGLFGFVFGVYERYLPQLTQRR